MLRQQKRQRAIENKEMRKLKKAMKKKEKLEKKLRLKLKWKLTKVQATTWGGSPKVYPEVRHPGARVRQGPLGDHPPGDHSGVSRFGNLVGGDLSEQHQVPEG